MAEPNTEASVDLSQVTGKNHPPGSIYNAGDEIAAILGSPTPEQPEAGEEAPEQEAEAPEEVEQEAEAGEAEPAEETEAEESSEEEATDEAEAADADETFVIEVDGESRELTASEILQLATAREEAQRESGRNEEKYQELVSKLEEAEGYRQSYVSRLEQFVQADDPRPKLADFDGDVDAHAEAMEGWYERQESKKVAHAELEKERERTAKLQHEAFQRHMASEAAALQQRAPHLANQKALNGLVEWLVKEHNFQPQEANLLADHRYAIIVDLARKGAEIEKAKPKVLKKVKSKPKVVRSGSPQSKQDRRNEGIAGKTATLKKTGNVRDAAAVFAEILDGERSQ